MSSSALALYRCIFWYLYRERKRLFAGVVVAVTFFWILMSHVYGEITPWAFAFATTFEVLSRDFTEISCE
jgi:hypothetical protein